MNPETLQKEAQDAMQNAITHMEHEFAGYRTGKASPALVENITVEVYGTTMRIRDMAAINVPDAHSMTIQPWDASQLGAVEKAIKNTPSLGINPVNDGKLVRLPFPPLTEERRKKLAKDIKDLAEKTRVNIRTIRREANDAAKKAQKDSVFTEDDAKRELDLIQKLTDKMIAEIDRIVAAKEKDLMTL